MADLKKATDNLNSRSKRFSAKLEKGGEGICNRRNQAPGEMGALRGESFASTRYNFIRHPIRDGSILCKWVILLGAKMAGG